MSEKTAHLDIDETDIAIVGMAAHLPGAHSITEYWDNLQSGIESIRHYSKEELLAAGEASHRLNRPDYVPAAAPLDGFEKFDAEFFGLSPKEAAIMDPQHLDNVGMFLLRHTGNDKDFLTTRLSHILDLKGPSVNLQTACSTSLVATHYAVQALLSDECDTAIAGGVTIELPQDRGDRFLQVRVC